MIKSNARGWDIHYDGKDWRYSDTNEIYNDSRPCKNCGKHPTKEGYDACLGYVKGAKYACCGHGIEKGYIIYD